MNSIYLYNKGTNRLHIQGLCHYSGTGGGLQKFDSEEDAIKAIGQPFVICKICQERRDKMLLKKGEDL